MIKLILSDSHEENRLTYKTKAVMQCPKCNKSIMFNSGPPKTCGYCSEIFPNLFGLVNNRVIRREWHRET